VAFLIMHYFNLFKHRTIYN